MPRVCGVCAPDAAAEARYKCPKCRLPYCSVGCFKTHREAGCSAQPAKPAAEPAPPPAKRARRAPGERPDPDALDEEAEEMGWELPRATLQRLHASDALRQQLAASGLRAELEAIDGAADREAALEAALQRLPELRSFVDDVLLELGTHERRGDGVVSLLPV